MRRSNFVLSCVLLAERDSSFKYHSVFCCVCVSLHIKLGKPPGIGLSYRDEIVVNGKVGMAFLLSNVNIAIFDNPGKISAHSKTANVIILLTQHLSFF